MKTKNEEFEQAYAQIMHMFRYYYQHEWASDKLFAGKSRVWINAFNKLIEQGFIKKKKQYPGYKYKWAAAFPKHY